MAFVTRRHSHFLAFLTPLGGWPICSVTVAYFAPVGRPVCSGTPAVLQLFVAVRGHQTTPTPKATMSQTMPNWIGSHVRAFQYFNSVPHILMIVFKSGVSDACYYEPEVNPTYTNMAEHYGCAVLPARPRKPRDKAKVEVGVLICPKMDSGGIAAAYFL